MFLTPLLGAYQPYWFMKYQHVHPGEAVQIHKDIRRCAGSRMLPDTMMTFTKTSPPSQQSLGIHWGTFKLTTEYYLEPAVLLTSFMNRLLLL